ncbi:hypothetical protein [Tenacibaculum maritimum]
MIRNAFHIDPSTLSNNQWAKLYQEAVWLKKFDLRMQAEMFAQLFGSKK